jgi:putative transcriptional regulator
VSSIHAIEPGLLLAAPRLGDPNFERTVVLLGVHDEDGSLGWVVNGDVIEDASTIVRATGLVSAGDSLPEGFDRAALRGGPVSPDTVWILYRRAAGEALLGGSIAVGDHIAVTATAEALKMLIAGEGPKDFRLLAGYAGWGPGQLARELSLGAWLPAAADAALLFEDERETLWERAYEKTIGTTPAAFVSTNRGSA